MLPPQEVKKALQAIISVNLGIEIDDAITECARLFGFRSTSPQLRSLLSETIEELTVENGLLGATLYYLPGAYIETAMDGTQAQSLAAWADGFIPFADPFESNGVYSTADNPIFGWSQFCGGISRDALLAAMIPNLGTWARNPFMYELGSTTIPGRLFASLSHLTEIQRGQALWRHLGWGAFGLSRYATWADWVITLPMLGTPGAWLTGIGTLHALDAAWDSVVDWWYGA